MNKAILLRKVSRKFGDSFALKDVSLSLPSRGIVGILGPSGCGKSTLLNILAGIDNGFMGSVKILGKELGRLSDAKRRDFRIRNIGYVFQNFNLLELETAEMNVMVTMDALYGSPKEDKRKKALDLLTFFGVDKKAKQKVNTLSGGEKQRVALARALATEPQILLCDEPTGALDERRANEVFRLLRRCGEDRLVLVVSHDRELTERYCDCIIHMRDGKVDHVENLEQEPKETSPKSFHLNRKRDKPRISTSFFFLHAFHLLRAKKWRSLIAEAAIATGLSGLGLSVYITNSISTELTAVFESIVPPSAIVMTPRGGEASPIGSVYGAGEEECLYAVEEYGDMVIDYGTDLHMDYENWFVDRNDFTFQSGVEQVHLNDFTVRHINDYLWFDPSHAPMCYPRTPATLRVDQLVLGLPYPNMFQTCLNLHIQRDYQSLGDYIDTHGLELVLHIANYEYGFDDEELFEVVAVVESKTPCLYHVDHHWNHKFFIDQLKFRSNISEHTLNPQYIFEIPYLELSCPASEFLYFARRDPNLQHLVYEMASSDYVPSVCRIGEKCELKRLYLYGADKTGVGFSMLDDCLSLCPEIAGRQPITSGSYFASNESLAMGFVGKFYVCRDKESAEAVIDFYSDLPLEAANLPGEEIDGTKDGSYFGASNNGIRISSDLDHLIEGEKPRGVEECVLSRGLYESWGRPREIYIAAEIGAKEVGDSYVRDFGLNAMKVVGVKEEAHHTFYVNSDWSVDFYLSSLGVSSFALEPCGAVFSLKEGADPKSVVERLSLAFGDYAFSNPADEIATSITSTLGYIGVILSAFSLIALFMSALLFLIVMTITVNENAKEANLFSTLGISKSDILRNYRAHCVLYAGGATLSALGMLVISELVTKVYIAQSFSANVNLSLPVLPLATTFVSGVGFSFFVMLGISANLRRKMSLK